MRSIEYYDAQHGFKNPSLANAIVKQYGEKLVGKTILTQRIGEWPGGLAVVTQIRHDKNAPEIVCLVRHANQEYAEEFGEMGIFHDEKVEVQP